MSNTPPQDTTPSAEEIIVLVPLCDTAKLLLPYAETVMRSNGHNLGAICKCVAAALVCSVWDLCVYQVPTNILTEGYEAAYAIFDNRTKQSIFLGYYGVVYITEDMP